MNHPSQLFNNLKQCFTAKQLEKSKISELVSIQTKLLLRQNPDNLLLNDNELSFDAVSQLTKMFCQIGSTAVENVIEKSEEDLELMDVQLVTLRKLLQDKRKHVQLGDKEKEDKLNKIKSFQEQLKELKSKCLQAAPPQLDHDQQMQDNFCAKLEDENYLFEKEISELKDYDIFEDITSNAQLETVIKEMEGMKNRYFEIETEPTKFESRLSFSFDQSSGEF